MQRRMRPMQLKKRNTAQFETVLDTSFNGIIKVNAEGKVIVVNKLVENLLGKNSEDLVGKSLTEILPGIDSLLIENILSGKSELLFLSGKRPGWQ